MTTRPKRTSSVRPAPTRWNCAWRTRPEHQWSAQFACATTLRHHCTRPRAATEFANAACAATLNHDRATRACTSVPCVGSRCRPQTTSARHHRVYRWCRHLTFGRGRASSVGRAASVHPLFSLRYSSGTSAAATACTEAYRKRSSSPFIFCADQRKTPHTHHHHTRYTYYASLLSQSLTASHMQRQYTQHSLFNCSRPSS